MLLGSCGGAPMIWVSAGRCDHEPDAAWTVAPSVIFSVSVQFHERLPHAIAKYCPLTRNPLPLKRLNACGSG
jgi:hypothetical protein